MAERYYMPEDEYRNLLGQLESPDADTRAALRGEEEQLAASRGLEASGAATARELGGPSGVERSRPRYSPTPDLGDPESYKRGLFEGMSFVFGQRQPQQGQQRGGQARGPVVAQQRQTQASGGEGEQVPDELLRAAVSARQQGREDIPVRFDNREDETSIRDAEEKWRAALDKASRLGSRVREDLRAESMEGKDSYWPYSNPAVFREPEPRTIDAGGDQRGFFSPQNVQEMFTPPTEYARGMGGGLGRLAQRQRRKAETMPPPPADRPYTEEELARMFPPSKSRYPMR